MAVRDCIKRLQDIAGRPLSDDEVSAVFERIHKAALDIKAGRVKEGLDLQTGIEGIGSAQQGTMLIYEAAKVAAAELQREAYLAVKRARLQVLKIGARSKDYKTLKDSGVSPLDAVKYTIARDYSGKSRVASLEQTVTGYRDYFAAKVLKTWDALGNDFFGFFQDREKLVNLIRELRGERTGDRLAKEGAKAYLDAAEEARKVFNDNGGSIGKLDDWGMPQHHSQEKVASAGGFNKDPAQAKQTWIEDILPMLDRTRYTDSAGMPMSDADMVEFLGHAWDSIATNGNANVVPGQSRGFGSRANRHNEARQIHFKDAESYIDYWQKYGEKTAADIMIDHLHTMARDIAFIDIFGPNPNTTYRTLRDMALTEATKGMPSKTQSLEGQAVKLDNLFNYASGKVIPTANITVRKTADAIAQLNVAGKLGGAMFASLYGDKPLMEAVSHLNDLPTVQRWQNELALLNPANKSERRLLQQQGLMLEGVRSGLQRFYEGLGDSSFSGKIANAVMRVTGMQAINDIRKGAFGMSLMNAIGHQIKDGIEFAQLPDSDIRTLRNYGITESDWAIWKLARLEDYGRGNDAMLTPEAISRIPDAELMPFGDPKQARRQAIVKLLGAINTETEFAVVTPGWQERAAFYADLQRGTLKGEIVRSVLQFKAFPWAQFQRGMDAVANSEGTVGKAVMASYLIAATTLAGAMLMQTREMLSGKDPRKMLDRDWYKFWGAAFISGGALGIYGDFLYSPSQNRYGSGILETLAGPTIGPLSSMLLVNPLNAIAKQIEGKESHLLAQEIQSGKSFIPGNNIWYTKAALDHLIWQRVMEMVSPGYLANMRSRTLRDYGQEWWWEPGETAPDRAPDLLEAVK